MLMQTADINNPGLLADLSSSLTSAEGEGLQEVCPIECLNIPTVN